MQCRVPPGAGTVTLLSGHTCTKLGGDISLGTKGVHSIAMEARWSQREYIWLIASKDKADDRNHLKSPLNTNTAGGRAPMGALEGGM